MLNFLRNPFAGHPIDGLDSAAVYSLDFSAGYDGFSRITAKKALP
jgi:hypothetical protein